MSKALLRSIHRWLGLIAGLQLLAWTVSGLYFTLIPIEEIRGNHILDIEAPSPTLANLSILSPTDLTGLHPNLANAEVSDIKLTAVLGSPVYLIGEDRINAVTGESLDRIDKSDAIAIVKARTSHEIIDTSLIESVAVDSEYRGGELPAWRFVLSEENAAIYVGTTTGRIRAVRTDAWRLFDLFWALHIMDYEEREDFNHWLIQLLSILGVITVISGLALFFMTQRWGSKQT